MPACRAQPVASTPSRCSRRLPRGAVLLAFLRDDCMHRLHWLSDRQLLDAICMGRLMPGPVSTAATFLGYLVAGWMGGQLATLGILQKRARKLLGLSQGMHGPRHLPI